MTDTTVQTIPVESETELHRHYDGQTDSQDAYIELDLRAGTLSASYDAEIGNAIPFSVHHGFERRFNIPVLTAEAANRAMQEIAPLADRMLADWDDRWNGNNMVAVLGDDAEDAEDAIETHLAGYDDDSDTVTEWGLEGAVNGEEGITAATTDAQLDAMETEILQNLAEVSEGSVAVCPELPGYLRRTRAELRVEAAPQVTAAHVRELLSSGAEEPVLYIEAPDGHAPRLAVGPAALAPFGQVAVTAAEAAAEYGQSIDGHSDYPEDDPLPDDEPLPDWQDTVESIVALDNLA